MAVLVSCPLCGREKISSATTSCPGCGHNVAKELGDTRRRQAEEQWNNSPQAREMKKMWQKSKSIRDKWEREKRCRSCGSETHAYMGSRYCTSKPCVHVCSICGNETKIKVTIIGHKSFYSFCETCNYYCDKEAWREENGYENVV